MNIGIDFDNTITENRKFFRKMTNSLKNDNDIYIISSCDKQKESVIEEVFRMKKKKLKRWGIAYKDLLLALEPIPNNKAKICREYRIGVMIDDDIRNLKKIRKHYKNTACLQYIV